ncbi:hypothetical protein PSECIP111951_04119 [Pseudoalteromonas holothuriae]|uniref:Orphan protein n=1 Tax=Pseudoalteromonas holothuriae TaxID=2963714 RepID=A0A9W4VW97_9GAMM|nr:MULTISPECIES: hypothetical protein [unclassified Pseudoalteromonas]CAH9067297.1 hypothetical protein PSECIP111854_04068 [Pseudoalteromonas sp. CIP111854]CAH9068352.1 hypothetical protein PSECIP111951_04119 [Pseudoalteromonas sp. CIP111951]
MKPSELRDSDLEKLQLEHQAAKLFLRCYEQQFGIPMRHIWHNEPNMPDVSCYQGEQRLDIEVAHLYGSDKEAMAVLGRSLSLNIQRELAAMAQAPSERRLLIALERLLKQKSLKRYHSERTWLLIRNASTLWHHDDFISIAGQLDCPSHHAFEQIWLLTDFYNPDLLRLDA